MKEYINEYLNIAEEIEYFLWEGKPNRKGSKMNEDLTKEELMMKLEEVRKSLVETHYDFGKDMGWYK